MLVLVLALLAGVGLAASAAWSVPDANPRLTAPAGHNCCKPQRP
jgi:hypothetical protein